MKRLAPDAVAVYASTAGLRQSPHHTGQPADSVPDALPQATSARSDAAASRVAYVIADGHGSCLDATDPALELLGTDIDTLRMLRVGDLTKPETPDSLTRQLVASCDNVGEWLGGTCELLRADGATVTGAFRRRSGSRRGSSSCGSSRWSTAPGRTTPARSAPSLA